LRGLAVLFRFYPRVVFSAGTGIVPEKMSGECGGEKIRTDLARKPGKTATEALFFALIAGLELQGSLLGGDAFSMTLGTATKWAVLHLLRFLSVVLFGIRWKLLKTMERETRIEPTTFSLGI
jgi:hypothetical protein